MPSKQSDASSKKICEVQMSNQAIESCLGRFRTKESLSQDPLVRSRRRSTCLVFLGRGVTTLAFRDQASIANLVYQESIADL